MNSIAIKVRWSQLQMQRFRDEFSAQNNQGRDSTTSAKAIKRRHHKNSGEVARLCQNA
jgi:hypothetical protein